MEKEKWQIETYWSFSTPLTFKLPSWKYVEIDLYLSEYIVTLRMRGYLIDRPCETCKGDGKLYKFDPFNSDSSNDIIDCPDCNGIGKNYTFHFIMTNNKEVAMAA